MDLYQELEKKTGLSIGLKQNGAITVATTKERMQELLRQATTAQLSDVEVHVLDKKQTKDLYPVVNNEDIIGSVFMPKDGQADPVGVTNVLAKAARMEGAQIFEKTPVTKILVKNNSIVGVETDKGKIDCEYVVLATGMWSRQIGEKMNVSIPLYPNEHFYVITEPMKDLPKNLPVLRDYNNCLYLKEDAGKMLVGIFEPNAKPAFKNTGVVPDDFSFGELPDDFDHFEPYLQKSFHRLPMLENAGIRKFFSGPESFTPDTQYLLGETPEIKKLFINTGRSLEGFYPLGEKIDNTGQVKDLSGNNFHGQLKDQNKNNATTITATQNYEIRLSSSLPANNRSSYFSRDRFVEVGYQEKLNPEKFTLIGWIIPNNDLHTMEGILSSEYNSTGYGLYLSLIHI